MSLHIARALRQYHWLITKPWLKELVGTPQLITKAV